MRISMRVPAKWPRTARVAARREGPPQVRSLQEYHAAIRSKAEGKSLQPDSFMTLGGNLMSGVDETNPWP